MKIYLCRPIMYQTIKIHVNRWLSFLLIFVNLTVIMLSPKSKKSITTFNNIDTIGFLRQGGAMHHSFLTAQSLSVCCVNTLHAE